MATRIDVEYDRQYTNSEIQEIIARATVTINVLSQLPVMYRTLPGIGMADYQTEVDSIESDLSQLSMYINQIIALLLSLDTKAGPLFAKNKKALRTLDGLLQAAAERALLDQITGATSQGGGGSSPPSPPAP